MARVAMPWLVWPCHGMTCMGKSWHQWPPALCPELWAVGPRDRTILGSNSATEHSTNQPFLYFGHFCDLRYEVLYRCSRFDQHFKCTSRLFLAAMKIFQSHLTFECDRRSEKKRNFHNVKETFTKLYPSEATRIIWLSVDCIFSCSIWVEPQKANSQWMSFSSNV